jgi:hypothetical protein
MPSPVNVATVAATGSQTITTTTETVVATLGGLNTAPSQSRVAMTGIVNITVGTGGTSVTLRVRRASVSGTVVGVAMSHTVAAGSNYSLAVQALDSPGEVAGATYVVTVAVTAATGNSTVNYAHLEATTY